MFFIEQQETQKTNRACSRLIITCEQNYSIRLTKKWFLTLETARKRLIATSIEFIDFKSGAYRYFILDNFEKCRK